MNVGTFRYNKGCKYCGNRAFEIINGWELRALKFHCILMCKRCHVSYHGWGFSPRRAYNNALKAKERLNR